MTSPTGRLDVRPITHQDGHRDWLRVPYAVFDKDRNWVPPLLLAERQRISPRHNPFFRFGEAAFFVAYRDGKPLGRISAQINRRHLDHCQDATGHFGFFDCVDDYEMASSLVASAERWLRERGLRRMVGPFSLTMLEDAGLLIAGFDTPPVVLCSHAPRWAGQLLEHCGLVKVIDLFAYRMRFEETPSKIARLAQLAKQSGRVRVRHFDMHNYSRDVGIVFDIFNDAWSDNWGFIPVSNEEIAHLAKETYPLLRSEYGCIIEIDGEPAAMSVSMPNLNSVINPLSRAIVALQLGPA